MRKMLRLGLCLGVLAAALTCTALAADDKYTTSLNGGTVTYNEETDEYTASYTGAVKGYQYALLVVKGTEASHPISEDTIMYINQTAADDNGTVSFENFIPKSTPDCVVLLGGDFGKSGPSSPVTLGTLIGRGVEVSGTVDIGVSVTSNITLTLYNPDGTSAGSSSMSSDGSYSIPSVSEGTYYIKASKPGFIGGLVEVTVTGDGNVSAVTVPLYGGDLNSSGGINSVDLMALLNDFGATEDMKNPYSDINESGGVNAVDLMELLNNFGRNDEKLPVT